MGLISKRNAFLSPHQGKDRTIIKEFDMLKYDLYSKNTNVM